MPACSSFKIIQGFRPPPLPERIEPPAELRRADSPSIRRLNAYIHSFAGDNGGSFQSPVWLCSLEAGGGEKDTQCFSDRYPERLDIASVARHPGEPEKWQLDEASWLLHGEDAPDHPNFKMTPFWNGQVRIMAALLGMADKGLSGRQLAARLGFLAQEGGGISLNLSPVSVSSRQQCEQEWSKGKKILDEHGCALTYKGWTGFSSYSQFLSYCAQERSMCFQAARRQYAPAILYCGGASAFDDYRRAWTGAGTAFSEAAAICSSAKARRTVRLRFTWLSNGPGKGETLLVIGPFFCNPYGLFWRSIRTAVACFLRQEALRHFSGHEGRLNAWLQDRARHA